MSRCRLWPLSLTTVLAVLWFDGNQERRIQNPVYCECALDGFKQRLTIELPGNVTPEPPLYSHHDREPIFRGVLKPLTTLLLLVARNLQPAHHRLQTGSAPSALREICDVRRSSY